MAKAPPSIAGTSTLAMVRAAAARGIETADVLAEAGTSLAGLEDPDCRLPGPAVLSIWNALRQRTADPVLQLYAPATLPFGCYRLIDYLVASSATVGDGVHRFARFFLLIADAVSLRIEAMGDEYVVSLSTSTGGPVPPVYVDYVFAALITRIRTHIRPALRVLRVDFRQPEPAAAGPYTEIFRAPVRFAAAADRLFFDRDEWGAPMLTADPNLAVIMDEHARLVSMRVPATPARFLDDARKAIAATLPDGGSAESVACALNVSVRTLQRKLDATGTTFRELFDDVRGKLAVEYLTDPRVSVAEVAFLLGFSEQSSFNRAFRRWTGYAPGRWRRLRA